MSWRCFITTQDSTTSAGATTTSLRWWLYDAYIATTRELEPPA
ncbi:hypothetical protein [Thermopirellula anaerolimosa]